MNVVIRQIALTLVVCYKLVYSEPPLSSQYGVPANLPVDRNNNEQPHSDITNSYGTPLGSHVHQDGHQDYIDSQPKSYEFGYAVKDSATGNDFGRQETSDGETVRGEYRVQLPDGRTQIVTYTADWRSGFHADVRYEGEATYPEQNNNGYSNNNHNNHNIDYANNNINNNNNDNNNNNEYNAAYNNLNSYDSFGYNYNQNNHNGYNEGNYRDHQNNYKNYNSQNNNNYQYPSSNNQYNGYNGNNFNSQPPRPTYGTPQYH